jgi:hypothetical protein
MFTTLKSLFSNTSQTNSKEQQNITFPTIYENEYPKQDIHVHQIHRTPVNPMDFYLKTFYKITNYTENHNGFQYRDGLNIDTQPFGQDDFCSNGLYFYDLQYLWRYRNMGVNVRKITLPEDAVYLEEEYYDMKKYKANKIILGEKIEIGSDKFINLVKNTNLENNKWVSNYICKYNDEESLNFCLKYNYLDSCDELEGDYEEDYIEFYKPAFKMAIVKKFFLNKNDFEGLYTLLNDNKIDVQNLISNTNLGFQIDQLNKFCNISIEELIQTSFKTRDVTFINYLKDFYIPKVVELTKTYREVGFFTNLLNNNNLNNIRSAINSKIPIKNISEFDKLLIDHAAFISGSFILNNVITQKFKPNNIDIIISKNNLNQFYSSLNNLFSLNGIIIEYKEQILNKYSHFVLDSYKIILNNKTVINLIGVTEPVKFIENYVDFNFSQCVYNGNDVLLSFKPEDIIRTGKITDDYINYIFSSELNDDTVYPLVETLERIIKYTKRGFIITNYKDFLEKIEIFLS